MKKVLAFVGLLLAALATMAEGSERVHTIKQGETLSGIARAELGNARAYVELAQVNGIVNPNLIYAGKTLRIPGQIQKVLRTTVKVVVRAAVKVSVSAFRVLLPHHSSSSTLSSSTAANTSYCFASIINIVASRVGIDANLLQAVILAESNCDPFAVSRAGASGLMQLMPSIQQFYSLSDPFDAESNIEAGAKQLRRLISQFGQIPLALAAYNAGPGAVEKYGGVPPFGETRKYITRVQGLLQPRP